MEPVHDFRLLLAVLTPLLGAGLVMAARRHPNLREAVSFLSAVILFTITATLVPDIQAGRTLVCPVFVLLPGLSITLRADPLSMLFALTASFLWILTVFYSAGYMRGLKEHAQTRFNACFCPGSFRGRRVRVLGQSPDALSVLRDCQRLHLPAGGASPGRGRLRGRQEILGLPDGHRQGDDPAGDGRDLTP